MSSIRSVVGLHTGLGLAMALVILKISCPSGYVEFDIICIFIIPYGQCGVNSLDDFIKNCRVLTGIIWNKSVL